MNINPRKHKPGNPYRCRSYNSSPMTVPTDDDVNHTADQITVSPVATRKTRVLQSNDHANMCTIYTQVLHQFSINYGIRTVPLNDGKDWRRGDLASSGFTSPMITQLWKHATHPSRFCANDVSTWTIGPDKLKRCSHELSERNIPGI